MKFDKFTLTYFIIRFVRRPLIGNWLMNHLPNIVLIIFYMLNFIISFGVVMLLFALLFKIFPNAKIQWKHLWWGSILTASLFILGKTEIGFYLSKNKSQLGIWCSRLHCINSSVGELFFHDIFLRCRVYPCLCRFFQFGKVSPTEVAVKITDLVDMKH